MDDPDLDRFRRRARRWLEDEAQPRSGAQSHTWGTGSDSVALFQNLGLDEERELVGIARSWQQRKSDAGYGSVSWAVEHGGAGLPIEFERAFAEEEASFETPRNHEAVTITLELVGPTIRAWGTDAQRARFLRLLRRTDEMWCQLFSEPGAGSDLAGVSARAAFEDGEWVIDGQKVWTSGAQFADWGYILCRTDSEGPKHAGLTAFLVPMSTEGVEVRPLRQMSGGSSFNEVFLTGVRVSDSLRLGPVGAGWKVALTTLGFERATSSGTSATTPGSWEQVLALARHLGRTKNVLDRDRLAGLHARAMAMRLTARRAMAVRAAAQTPGPEGSIGKLAWTENLRATSDIVSHLLGPRLIADTGEWGTYAWSEFVTGVPGYRIAGGSDEIQRNIIAERVLGLPSEARRG